MEKQELNYNKNNCAVCILTYKRPKYLRECIDSIIKQEYNSFDIIVVDNDILRSSEKNVNAISPEIIYLVENKKGIPFARNTAVKFCLDKGYKYIIFIDDDEIASSNWLILLFSAMQIYKADIVQGQVIPKFENSKPFWTENFSLYNNSKKRETGDRLNSCNTNNTLIKSKVFYKYKNPFDIRLANTGGSDTMFFSKISKKYKIIWSSESIVYENIPSSRQTLRWNFMRCFRNGNAKSLINNYTYNKKKINTKIVVRILELLIRILVLPLVIILTILFYYLINLSLLIKLISKMYYCVGYISGYFNFRYNEYEKIHGE